MRDLSIYIHIPFCVRKCFYCDFLSFPVSGFESMESYVNLLRQELLEAAPFYRQHRVISVFLGGGTPSVLLPGQVAGIMDEVRTCYCLAEDAEISIEMNPGTVDDRKLHEYIACGINRASIGLQSTDDGELKRIGRIHDYSTFTKTYEAVRKAGFCNVNIDLMAALPGQGVASYEKTLRRTAALMPEHISAYSLILEEGTPLYEKREKYCFPTEEEDRAMYLLTRDYLASVGYHRYEISNYAREGFACRHNMVYWQRGDYVGFGLGAASMVDNTRWGNPGRMEEYRDYVGRISRAVQRETGCVAKECTGKPVRQAGECAGGTGNMAGKYVPGGYAADRQVLTLQEQMEEYMFLGLRMMCGVGRQAFEQEFGCQVEEVYGEALDKLYRQKLLVQDQDRIRLTDFGIDVSNYAMSQFLFD